MRYAIWDKKTPVIVPTGNIFTPEQWIERYPVAGLESVTVICADGEINGGLFDTLGSMVQRFTAEGCDFSACTTDAEKLATIEAFEDARTIEARARAEEKAQTEAVNNELTAMSLASIAASMEYQNMMTLPDEEV